MSAPIGPPQQVPPGPQAQPAAAPGAAPGGGMQEQRQAQLAAIVDLLTRDPDLAVQVYEILNQAMATVQQQRQAGASQALYGGPTGV